jgi:hypothetical protein
VHFRCIHPRLHERSGRDGVFIMTGHRPLHRATVSLRSASVCHRRRPLFWILALESSVRALVLVEAYGAKRTGAILRSIISEVLARNIRASGSVVLDNV